MAMAGEFFETEVIRDLEQPKKSFADCGVHHGFSLGRIQQIAVMHGILVSGRTNARVVKSLEDATEKWNPKKGTALYFACESAREFGLPCAPVALKSRGVKLSTHAFLANGIVAHALLGRHHRAYSDRSAIKRTHFHIAPRKSGDFHVFVQCVQNERRIYVVPCDELKSRQVYIPVEFRDVPYRNASGFPWKKYRDAWHLLLIHRS